MGKGGDLHVKFLGTGAADWVRGGSFKRNSSVLLDGKVLIDLTESVLDILGPCRPEIIFYTHSHGDHFQPETAMNVGVRKVYLSDTWYERALSSFREVSGRKGVPVPEIVPLHVGDTVSEEGIDFTVLPSNHATSDPHEQTVMYLLEKGKNIRVLYATDTGGIPAAAGRLMGIDTHVRPGRPVSGLIMEATMPDDEDFRIFTHSSYHTVSRTVNMLVKNGRYCPPDGQPVFLTHIASSIYRMSDDHLDSILPAPLVSAKDGMETVFSPGSF